MHGPHAAAAVLPASVLLAGPYPALYVVWLRLVFIGRFGLRAFAVGTRVALAHGSYPVELGTRPPARRWFLGFLGLALASRITYGLITEEAERSPFLRLAAACWILAAGSWSGSFLREIWKPGPACLRRRALRLTDHTDYSLRVLMYLNAKKSQATLNELSERLGLSKNNLIKVSNQLAKFGFIDTSRGRSGGLTIRKETGKLTLRDILLRTEESLHLAECFSGKGSSCTFLKRCLLKRSLKRALDAFLDSLGQTTLNDVTLSG
jgi:Rrf2 family nitric oxide-sensitive transcriptional repressor